MNPALPYGSLFRKPKAKKIRKPIRRRTPKRAAEEVRYRKEVKEWLPNKFCAVAYSIGVHKNATQVHHKFGRRGRLLLWKLGWVAVSDFGQSWIHNNPKEARAKGFLCEVGQWNNQSLVPKE